MKDLAIALDNRPGALADMGEALGKWILVVDDIDKGRAVARAWTSERA